METSFRGTGTQDTRDTAGVGTEGERDTTTSSRERKNFRVGPVDSWPLDSAGSHLRRSVAAPTFPRSLEQWLFMVVVRYGRAVAIPILLILSILLTVKLLGYQEG